MKKALISIISMLVAGLTTAQTVSNGTHDNQAQLILSELRHDLTALQAEFKQYEQTPDGRVVDENTGIVWMQAPDFFKWHYQSPFEQLSMISCLAVTEEAPTEATRSAKRSEVFC